MGVTVRSTVEAAWLSVPLGVFLQRHVVGFLPVQLRVVLRHVQALVDAARDGLDLRHQLVLDGFQVEAVLRSDQVDSQTQVTKTP